ncbi:MAG: helix-turn-helix transcriptional regulator [Clostridia bacterium]|nr:helix-turn-helix transcriptional regulator [Clostridia bacterium]
MGDQIRNLRRKKHLTRRYLAEHTGVSILRVMLWEINLQRPDDTMLVHIASALGVTLRELTGKREVVRQAAPVEAGTLSPFPFAEDLSDGERLLWHGQPNKNRLFTSADAVNIPVSLFFLAFSVWWTYLAILANAWLLCVSIPLFLVALHLLLFRFLVKRYVKGRTYYALTDARILLIYDGKDQRQIRSIPYSEVRDVRMTLAGQGGSLYFDVYGYVAVSRAASQRIDNTGLTTGVGDANAFFDLADPKSVLQTVQEQIALLKDKKSDHTHKSQP